MPEKLKFADGFSVRQDWNRLMSTCFNGASNVAQAGGLACLSDEGMAAMTDLVAFYKVGGRVQLSNVQLSNVQLLNVQQLNVQLLNPVDP